MTSKLLIQPDNANLVEDFREYKYSSAGFYELENYSGYMIDHYLEV